MKNILNNDEMIEKMGKYLEMVKEMEFDEQEAFEPYRISFEKRKETLKRKKEEK